MDTTAPFALARPIQQPDPFEAAGKLLALRTIAQQGQMRNLEIQQQQQAITDDLRSRQFFAQNPNPSEQDTLSALGPKVGLPIIKEQRAARIQRIEEDQKKAEFIGQSLGAVKDQDTYVRALGDLQNQGIDVSKMPTQYDQNTVQGYVTRGQSIQQQLETARQNELLQMQRERQGPELAKTNAEADKARAETKVQNLNAELMQHKLDLYNTLKGTPGALEQRVAKAVDPAQYPEEYKRTLAAAQSSPTFEGIEAAIKDGGDRIGRLQAGVAQAKATAPIKVNIATQEAAAKNALTQPNQSAIDLMAEDALNGKYPPGRNQMMYAQVMNRAAELAKERGLSNQQVLLERNAALANKGALNSITKQYETLKPFADMAEKNANILEQKMQDVTDLGAPLLNTPIRELEQKFGSTKVTALKAALQPVQADFARILNSPTGGGVLSDHARSEMQGAIQAGATVGQIKAALDVFRTDAKNRRESYEASIKDLGARSIAGGQSPSTTAAMANQAATVPANVKAALGKVGAGIHTLSDGSKWMKSADGTITPQ